MDHGQALIISAVAVLSGRLKSDHLLQKRGLTLRGQRRNRCLAPAKKDFPSSAKVNLVDARLRLVQLAGVVRDFGQIVEADAPADGTLKSAERSKLLLACSGVRAVPKTYCFPASLAALHVPAQRLGVHLGTLLSSAHGNDFRPEMVGCWYAELWLACSAPEAYVS
jgi:hypothetical protein